MRQERAYCVYAVWRELPKFRDVGSLENWVYGIADYECPNASRRPRVC